LEHLDSQHVVGLGAASETSDTVIDQHFLGVNIVGKLNLLVANGETLQEVCGAFLMEYGKAGKGLVKMEFVDVGDVSTLGFDQFESSITKSFVATDQSTKGGIHHGKYEEK
jgi:hypothetical protein